MLLHSFTIINFETIYILLLLLHQLLRQSNIAILRTMYVCCRHWVIVIDNSNSKDYKF